MGESSPPLVAPRKGEVGSALPKIGSMIPPKGGTTTTTTTTTARTLDDLADLRDLDEDALLQALQDDPELAEMVYREFEGELRREREEEEVEGGGEEMEEAVAAEGGGAPRRRRNGQPGGSASGPGRWPGSAGGSRWQGPRRGKDRPSAAARAARPRGGWAGLTGRKSWWG